MQQSLKKPSLPYFYYFEQMPHLYDGDILSFICCITYKIYLINRLTFVILSSNFDKDNTNDDESFIESPCK